jgi:sorting and assembly machinery component 37
MLGRIGDAVAEDRKRVEEVMIVGPGGTVAPRAWSGWRAGREAEERKQKFGEEEVCEDTCRSCFRWLITSM